MLCRRAIFGLLLLVLCGLTASQEEGVNLKNGQELGSAQLDVMPDTSDPATSKQLKCGICKMSVMEMLYGYLKMETDAGRKLREVEAVEVFESTCSKQMDAYGLLLDDAGKPTVEWSNDMVALKAKGGWVSRLAMDTCNDVYNEFEDYLVENAPKTCKIEGNERRCQAQPVVRYICQKGLRLCPKGSFPEEYVGDQGSAGGEEKKEL